MALGKDYDNQRDCSLARALELVGERWTMLIVRDAFFGVRRYSDFLSHLETPRAVLADRLSNLVAAGILAKRRYSDSPVREEYVLTDAGRALWPVLAALGTWSARYVMDGEVPRIYAHAECGRRLTGGSVCPSCGPVGADEVEIRPGPDADFVREDPVSVALREPKRLLVPIRG
ncbi:helix-turn-helix domain-containing protein [Phytomonospora sp. NPDC050363]|uniref:winged helix-turn-helix transcriptional regulator n=1 Tax=Phytomonospora sp. NPDC050363 TaxID=3155642 RepID=UPI003409D6E1